MYNGSGIVVETVTHLEDIPLGDCFNVEDRWVVSPTTGAGGRPAVRLEVVFEIRWMKVRSPVLGRRARQGYRAGKEG